jgi:nitroimidazol reductase NimA-like FMN-containing flavoprotein (pyridoxamine 5'-phosphate oxidase superfamily)
MSVPQDIENLIAGAPLSAHLATTADDRPHVAPVWYGYRDGVLSVITGGKNW